jgi:hypothetical protein
VKIFDPKGTWIPASPGRPARSHSLYRLSYPGSLQINVVFEIMKMQRITDFQNKQNWYQKEPITVAARCKT